MNRWLISSLLQIIAAAIVGSGTPIGAAITNASFVAALTNGSLSGSQFAVRYSYDATAITGGAEDHLSLESFDFSLSGVQFSTTNSHQGGQAIFHYGTLYNVTAEFYLPPSKGRPAPRSIKLPSGSAARERSVTATPMDNTEAVTSR